MEGEGAAEIGARGEESGLVVDEAEDGGKACEEPRMTA